MAKLLNAQIIQAETVRGEGKTEEDPVRRVEQWFSPDGTLLLAYDPHLDKTTGAINIVEFLRSLEVK